ncbi:MAG: hypothetical protein AAF152_00560 [Cyanobacteria bacterium P01_A01_bin.114]
MHSLDSSHLRLIWGIVDAHGLLIQGLSDEALCFWILKHIKDRLCLSYEEDHAVKQYVSNRIHLIRDIADTP